MAIVPKLPGVTSDGASSLTMPRTATLSLPRREVRDGVDAGQVGREVLQVGRDVAERLAGMRAGGAGARRGGKVDHLLEVGDALVEVVVAERVDLDAHQALGMDRRLLVEEADSGGVAPKSSPAVSVSVGPVWAGAIGLPARRDVPGAAGGGADRIQVGVPVGHVQDLQVDGWRGRRLCRETRRPGSPGRTTPASPAQGSRAGSCAGNRSGAREPPPGHHCARRGERGSGRSRPHVFDGHHSAVPAGC